MRKNVSEASNKYVKKKSVNPKKNLTTSEVIPNLRRARIICTFADTEVCPTACRRAQGVSPGFQTATEMGRACSVPKVGEGSRPQQYKTPKTFYHGKE